MESRFLKLPRSMADIGRIQEMCKAINALRNGQVLGGRVTYSDGNTIWEIFQHSTTPFHPFKLYQPSNVSDFIGEMAPMYTDTAGVPVMCQLTDENTPTNLEADPPTVSVGDIWRFWSIRSGVIEARSNYTISSYPDSFAAASNYSIQIQMTGEKQLPSGVNDYTDGIGWQTDAPLSFDTETDKTLNAPLVIGINPSDGQDVIGGFWIQIIPDTSVSVSPSAQIYGFFEATEGELNFTGYLPPNNMGSNAVPVAMLQIVGTSATITQLLFGNVLNRYPCGNGNFNAQPSDSPFFGFGISTVGNFRGTANVSETQFGTVTPNDLVNQIFYPGDQIWEVVFDGEGDIIVWGLYQFIGPFPAFVKSITPPGGGPNYPDPSTDSNWTPIFTDSKAIG